MDVKLWSSEFGCDSPASNILDKENKPIAYIMKRGGCTYLQKASNVRLAGGKLAIVVLDSEYADPDSIIPTGEPSII